MTTMTWTGATGTSWSSAANWTGGAVPGAGDDALIVATATAGAWPTLASAALLHQTVQLAPGASYGTDIALSDVRLTAGTTIETTGGLTSAQIDVGAGTSLQVQRFAAIVARYDGAPPSGLIMNIGDPGGNAMIANSGMIAAEPNTTLDLTVWGRGVVNNGRMIADGGRLEIGEGHGVHNGVALPPVTPVSGHGTIDIAHGGALSFNATLLSGTICFDDGTGTLWLWQQAAGQPIQAFQGGAVSGFQAGDRIDMFGVAANGLSYTDNALSVTENGGAVTTIPFKGDYTQANFALAPDGFGGTAITYVPGVPPSIGVAVPMPSELPGAALVVASMVQAAPSGGSLSAALPPDAPPVGLLLHTT